MKPTFKNMEELTTYLENLEKRVNKLEEEKRGIQKIPEKTKLPNTKIISPNFLTRAFSIWGHFITAHFIISAIGLIIYFCIVIVLIGGLLRSISNIETIPTPETYLLLPTFPVETTTPIP